MGLVATVAEVNGAQTFLRYLGSNWQDKYLILAVVTWLRAESGGLSWVIGNNPFNLRPGADDAKFRTGIRRGRVGSFSVYGSIEDGYRATANRLLRTGNDYRGYGLIVAAARRGSAVDFLVALAMSWWDVGHYGVGYNEEYTDPRANNLLRIYSSFTEFTMPAAAPKPTSAPPKAKPVPRALQVNLALPNWQRDYLDGFDSRNFYRERHKRRPSPLQ